VEQLQDRGEQVLLAHMEEMLQKVVKMLDEESRSEAWRELDVLVRQLTEVQAMESLVKALQALASTPGGHGLEQLHITMWRRPRKYVNEESRISMPLETVLELPGVQCFPQQLLAVDMLEVPALADEQTWRDDEPPGQRLCKQLQHAGLEVRARHVDEPWRGPASVTVAAWGRYVELEVDGVVVMEKQLAPDSDDE
jgi:hypothetical protein